MAKRIVDLPKAEWRAKCLADANKVRELSFHLDMCREDGNPPELMTVRQILKEAEDCLSYFSDGTAADACEDGDKQALKDRRELRAFLNKWLPRFEARKAAFYAARSMSDANGK